MGKSAGKKKKPTSSSSSSSDVPPSKMDLDAAVFLRRAHELKEEGNRRFQLKEYTGAMEQYEQALKLIPKGHPDRAVFHSNRAACLMQMKPIQYESVISECTLGLEAHPKFGRALFRRARAYEALGKLELALQDVQLLLQGDANYQDALELAKRLRVALGNREEAQQDLQSRPTVLPASYAGTSPAALGASVVRGSPVGGRGPCLPARSLLKKKGKPEAPPKVSTPAVGDSWPNGVSVPASSPVESSEFRSPTFGQAPRVASLAKEPPVDRVESPVEEPAIAKDSSDGHVSGRSLECQEVPPKKADHVAVRKNFRAETISQTRPLKLIYDHDIRLAQLPVNCKYGDLRELVRKRYPSSRSVLIKYKDVEGDLVTITSTAELRLAEAVVAVEAERKRTQALALRSEEQLDGSSLGLSSTGYETLRLHVVEVSEEQEPVVQDEELIVDSAVEDMNQSVEETSNNSGDSVGEQAEPQEILVLAPCKDAQSIDPKELAAEKAEDIQLNGKEIEIDEWLLDFAHLFRTHLGIDPDGHIDLHELGMELCAEALEETVTSEEAHQLFELAACKFQEVAALAFFNWGNVHMCAARKRVSVEESDEKGEMLARLQAAFDWAQAQYSSAEQRYEEALRVKPDFYEGVLALGQEKFESAKLRWSVAVASKVDFSNWDSSETLALFSSAEEKMQKAVEMWEKLEEQRMNEAKASVAAKKDSLKLDSRSHGNTSEAAAEVEAAEQVVVMRSQINLFWGNILFEHSQVEFRLGSQSWKELLDAAVQKFQLAGASAADIAQVLKNHVSNASNDSASAHDGPGAIKVCLYQGQTCKHGNDIRTDEVRENVEGKSSYAVQANHCNPKNDDIEEKSVCVK